MAKWTEEDSSIFREIAEIATPRRNELFATLLDLVPFDRSTSFRAVELGSGEGALSQALLERFPHATVLALDGSESMRGATSRRTTRYRERVKVRSFDLATLEWWDLMHGADLVVSAMSLHHLNDAKKQYLYKAVAERLTVGGAFLIADLVEPQSAFARAVAADQWDRSAEEQARTVGKQDQFARFLETNWNQHRHPDPADQPSALLHHLVWLKHAGFSSVDCFWMYAGHAVFGGVK